MNDRNSRREKETTKKKKKQLMEILELKNTITKTKKLPAVNCRVEMTERKKKITECEDKSIEST